MGRVKSVWLWRLLLLPFSPPSLFSGLFLILPLSVILLLLLLSPFPSTSTFSPFYLYKNSFIHGIIQSSEALEAGILVEFECSVGHWTYYFIFISTGIFISKFYKHILQEGENSR